MLNSIKLALRINHNKLDDEINDTINAARAEMVRAGVSDEVAYSDAYLTKQCIKTYALMNFCNDKNMAERYEKSFEYQLENIRKSSEVG